jgi:hypothetical protein
VDKYPGGVLYFPPLDNRVVLTKVEAVDVVWESEPLFSDIVSTKLIVEGPLQKLQLQYDSIRRRLHNEGGEERHDMETYVIRQDEALQNKSAWGEMHAYWCLQLEYAENDGKQISTFLVLEENEGCDEMRIFRRIGCGRMDYRDVRFDHPPMERFELI